MKDRDREIISHLMDGEWGGLDLSRCLGDVCESEEKKQVWARYHLVRDGMRSESVDETFSIADRVSAAIADEPSYSNVTSIGSSDSSQGQEQVGAHHDNTVAVQPQAEWAGTGTQRQSSQPARSRWGLGATGFGIAASAALATVVGLDYWETRQLTSTPSALVAQSAPAQQEPKASPATVSMVASNTQSPVMQNVANRGVFWSSSQDGKRAVAEKRLNQLLGDHIEHSPAGNWYGVLPYSRLVGYDSTVVDGQ